MKRLVISSLLLSSAIAGNSYAQDLKIEGEKNFITLNAQYAIDHDDNLGDLRGHSFRIEIPTNNHLNLGFLYKKTSAEIGYSQQTLGLLSSRFSQLDAEFHQIGPFFKLKTDNQISNLHFITGFLMNRSSLKEDTANAPSPRLAELEMDEVSVTMGLGFSVGDPDSFTVDADYQVHFMGEESYRTRALGVSIHL